MINYHFPETAYIGWMKEQLKRFSYRPGWVFHIQPVWNRSALASDECVLVIKWDAEDSRNPGKRVSITGSHPLSGEIRVAMAHNDRNEGVFARWLQEGIAAMEKHESQEWLRRDGEIYDDPHK